MLSTKRKNCDDTDEDAAGVDDLVMVGNAVWADADGAGVAADGEDRQIYVDARQLRMVKAAGDDGTQGGIGERVVSRYAVDRYLPGKDFEVAQCKISARTSVGKTRMRLIPFNLIHTYVVK